MFYSELTEVSIHTINISRPLRRGIFFSLFLSASAGRPETLGACILFQNAPLAFFFPYLRSNVTAPEVIHSKFWDKLWLLALIF